MVEKISTTRERIDKLKRELDQIERELKATYKHKYEVLINAESNNAIIGDTLVREINELKDLLGEIVGREEAESALTQIKNEARRERV